MDKQINPDGQAHSVRQSVLLPAPTAWPILLAAGLTLILAALVTNIGIGFLGMLLAVFSAVGWFREVLPLERHEHIEVEEKVVEISPVLVPVSRIAVNETHRAQLPLQTFPVVSGLKGGVAGGIAMIIPAELYGLLRFHSPWYVVNLLGGAGAADWRDPTLHDLAHFRLSAFVTASVIHATGSLLVGLLYGALLPAWPKRPILLGGLLAPMFWTGLLYSILGIVNPFLAQRIDWWSFAASQILFGVVAGITVVQLGGIKRLAQAPLSVRLGVETPGMHPDGKEPRT